MQSKRKSVKRILAFMLVLTLAVPMVCNSVFASEDDSIVSMFEDGRIIKDECNVYCGIGEEYDLISTFDLGRTVKILARIQNWYMIYDYKSGITGAVKTSDISLMDPSGSDDLTDFENNPADGTIDEVWGRMLKLIEG